MLRINSSRSRAFPRQNVADAAHGLDVARLLRRRFDLGAQLGDVDVDGAVEGVELFAAQGLEDLVARKHPAGRARQERQELELVVREDDAAGADAGLARREVDLELADL